MAWIKPTGFVDSDSKWTEEAEGYDGNYNTSAAHPCINVDTWSSYIEFTHAAMVCSKIKFMAYMHGTNRVDIDAYYGSAWHDVYEGTFTNSEDVEKLLASVQTITAFRFRFKHQEAGHCYAPGIMEVDFSDALAEGTTQDPNEILPTTATGNGNITDLHSGGNVTERGFKYGLTKTNTWSASDSGSFGTGTFTKGLTGLIANTSYWIRAFFTNPQGTTYGEWIQFQTAASGVIPTGTMLFICSDYTGYTYQLMRSETDDGETYTAYFIISTDLTDKRSLAYYKRILDLHLYFMSESSGTATIEVKRDNEASWQTVGTVSLTGTADIIVPHLAPDIRAKHFLFKISASNFFRFLGVLFEYLPEDMR